MLRCWITLTSCEGRIILAVSISNHDFFNHSGRNSSCRCVYIRDKGRSLPPVCAVGYFPVESSDYNNKIKIITPLPNKTKIKNQNKTKKPFLSEMFWLLYTALLGILLLSTVAFLHSYCRGAMQAPICLPRSHLRVHVLISALVAQQPSCVFWSLYRILGLQHLH